MRLLETLEKGRLTWTLLQDEQNWPTIIFFSWQKSHKSLDIKMAAQDMLAHFAELCNFSSKDKWIPRKSLNLKNKTHNLWKVSWDRVTAVGDCRLTLLNCDSWKFIFSLENPSDCFISKILFSLTYKSIPIPWDLTHFLGVFSTEDHRRVKPWEREIPCLFIAQQYLILLKRLRASQYGL